MVETTTSGWICSYCQATVPYGRTHCCPAFYSTPQKVDENLGEYYFKCPQCGELIMAKLGHYILFPLSVQKIE